MPAAVEGEIAGEPSAAPDLPPGAEPFVILKQDVEVEVDFREKSISGVSTIHLFTINPDLDEIWLDAASAKSTLRMLPSMASRRRRPFPTRTTWPAPRVRGRSAQRSIIS